MSAYKIDELAQRASVSPRTIRYYVQRGLLPAPEFRGKDTAYGREHLLRLQAIKRLQEAHLPLDEIQSRLMAASDREIERMAAPGVPEPDEREPPATPQGGRGGPYRAPGYQDPAPPLSTTAAAPERWARIRLAPGLELHVRSDAGPETQRVAREIQSQYGIGPVLE